MAVAIIDLSVISLPIERHQPIALVVLTSDLYTRVEDQIPRQTRYQDRPAMWNWGVLVNLPPEVLKQFWERETPYASIGVADRMLVGFKITGAFDDDVPLYRNPLLDEDQYFSVLQARGVTDIEWAIDIPVLPPL